MIRRVIGMHTTQKSQNCGSMWSVSSTTLLFEVPSSASKKELPKMEAMVFVGKKTIVTTAMRIMSFESAFRVRESDCVTRLNDNAMRLLMRLSRLIRRALVALTADLLYNSESKQLVCSRHDGLLSSVFINASMISRRDDVDSRR
jgi:hypothetical protein